jgi:hypothetical protein
VPSLVLVMWNKRSGKFVLSFGSWNKAGHCNLGLQNSKQLSFYFSVYFQGSSSVEQPLGIMLGGDSPIFICSHLPIKIKLFTCIEIRVLGGSPEAHALRWSSLTRTHSYRNLH